MTVCIFERLEVFDDQLVALYFPFAVAAGHDDRHLGKRHLAREPTVDSELVGERLVARAVAVGIHPFDGDPVGDGLVLFEQRLDVREVLLVSSEEDVDLNVLCRAPAGPVGYVRTT